MPAFDPLALARFQLSLDEARTQRFPGLLARKVARMSASPLAFLRGAAPLFYELLRTRPALAKGPAGSGWIAGDLHLENFGAYRPEAGAGDAKRDPIEFDLNDFDEAIDGPWRLDVLRLTTSLIVGGRELGASGPRTLDLCERLLAAYVANAFAHAARSPATEPSPRPVAELIARVRDRSRKALLDGRTELVKGARRFVRGDRYADLAPEIAAEVPGALAGFFAHLPAETRQRVGAFEVLDSAFRVAGTGSLGSLRIAALVVRKGADGGEWVFDIKEQGTPAGVGFAEPRADSGGRRGAELAPAERVETAMRACLPRPPRMIGTTTIGGMSMLVRRLAPQEDKLALTRIRADDLDALATSLGALTGRAHAHAATKPPTPATAWSASDRAALLDSAIAMAGIHEAAYLAWCRLTR